MTLMIATLALSSASATTPADKYGQCGDYQSETQSYTMSDYNGRRTIWAPSLFCSGKTALFTMDSGTLTMNPDGSGTFYGQARVVSGGCGTFDNTVWDVSYDVNGTDPRYAKVKSGMPAPAGFPWQEGLLENGKATHGDYVMTFDNYPFNNDYGHQVGINANVKDRDLGGAVWFGWWLKKAGQLVRDGKGDFNFDLTCIPPEDTCPTGQGLGAAADYNVFVCDDFEGHNSDIQGRAAIGGSMNVSNYGIGSRVQGGGTVLAVGADLTATNAQVYGGDADVGGYCDVHNFGSPNGSLTCGHPTVFDASDACGDLCATAGELMNQASHHCDITIHPWGSVELDTHGDAICNLDLDVVKHSFAPYVWRGLINGLTVRGDRGSSVVVNVSSDDGNAIWGKNGSFNLQGVDASDVVWNFGCGSFCPSSARSPLAGVGIKGSVLAPSCDMHFDNGHIDGNYVVKSHRGNAQFHDIRFDGDVCID